MGAPTQAFSLFHSLFKTQLPSFPSPSPTKPHSNREQTCAEAKDAKKIVTLFYLD